MKLPVFASVGLAALLMATVACADTYTFVSTKQQSGFAGVIAVNRDPMSTTFANGTPITTEAFDFTDQPFRRITQLTSWSLTLTINDGDTGPNDYDYRNVYYYFDGVHARTWANGFLDGALITRTQNNPLTNFTDTLPEITKRLVSDGRMMVTLVEGAGGGNRIDIPANYSATLRFTATLSAVPESSASGLALAGALTVAGIHARRRRQRTHA